MQKYSRKQACQQSTKILRNRRLSLFGHVARLDPEVPANKALMVNSHEGRKPSTSWTRPSGRPRRTWLNLVQEDANAIPLSSLWRTEISRVVERRNGPSRLRKDDDDVKPSVNN